MSARLDAMRRLVRLQTQVKRLAEARLAEAEAQRRDVEAARHDLEAFAAEGPLAGKLASLVVGQRRRLGARAALAQETIEARTAETRDAKGRLKIAERMSEALEIDERRASERRELERLIEAMAGRT